MKAKYTKAPAERVVKDICRATRKQYSAEEKIRIVLEGLLRSRTSSLLAARGISSPTPTPEPDSEPDIETKAD